MNKLFCVGYIALMVGVAIGSVGKVSKTCGEPYQWWLPLALFLLLSIPAWYGYWTGRDDK